MAILFYASPEGTPGNDSYTKLLLHGDENPLIDSSASAHVLTPVNAARSAIQSKFGGYSIYFDGSGDYITIPNSTDWTFPSDFTIDFWIYPISTTGHILVCGGDDNWSGDLRWQVYFSGGDLKFQYYYFTDVDINAGTISTDQWHHVAIVRIGTTFTMYVDGISQGTDSSSNIASNTVLVIGTNGGPGTNYCNAYVDEIRISNGMGRWPTDFTPPTSQYI